MHPCLTCGAASHTNKPARHKHAAQHISLFCARSSGIPGITCPESRSPGPQSICPHDIASSDTVSPYPAGTRCMLSPACWWEVAS